MLLPVFGKREGRICQSRSEQPGREDYGTDMTTAAWVWKGGFHKCDNARLQLKKSKRITVRHFYSLVPMSVVLSPKATPQESSPGAPKVFR